ncbi:ATP-grasp fold amidoligase family protein [Vreelandella stevensii]|uniref:ATP-grasp fold amidoligase family protein n=1 Tax=Vreelandella stevensii TaxID=502821 RepID=UPI00037E8F1D|nr:ATP-grasp fold amidoligase family protein [Halomonas stevensii]
MIDKRSIYLDQSASTFWQHGDWEQLSRISVTEAEEHEGKVKVLLYLIDGAFHSNNQGLAKEIARKLLEEGVSKELLLKTVFSSLCNTLGRANVLCDNNIKGFNFFEAAIGFGMEGAQVEVISNSRANEQLKQLGYHQAFYYKPLEESSHEITLSKDELYYCGIAQSSQKTASDLAHKVYLSFLSNKNSINPWLLRRIFFTKYRKKMGYWPNADNPKTLNEKIQWRKFYDHNPLFGLLIDKHEAKSYVQKICPDLMCIKTQDIARKFEDLEYQPPCIVKLTSDSGGLWLIDESLGVSEIEAIKNEVNEKIKKTYGLDKAEWGYGQVDNRIIAEDFYTEDLIDYSFYCFHGDVGFFDETKFRLDGKNKSRVAKSFYNKDFTPIENLSAINGLQNSVKEPLASKEQIEKAYRYVATLSKYLDFVRIDLFFDNKNSRWIFGEFTFYPGEGAILFNPSQFDAAFGAEWKVNDYVLNPTWSYLDRG